MFEVAGGDPAELADEIIASTRDTDPKAAAQVIAGSSELLKKLSLARPDLARWQTI